MMTEMSLDRIRITANSCKVDFNQARRLAEQVVRGMVSAPQLIAWGDRKKKQSLSREVGHAGLSSSHDTGVRVDINDNQYSFIFTETN